MTLTSTEQLIGALQRAQNILVIFRNNDNFDEATSAAALGEFLRAIGKNAEVVADDFVTPPELRFLPALQNIRPTIGAVQQLTVAVRAPAPQLENHSCVQFGDEIILTLTPRRGVFTPTDVTVHASAPRFDLIITVGAPNLLSLGKIYTDQPQLFTTVPVINFDYAPTNEFFGQINVVDLASTSVAELLLSILPALSPAALTPAVANLLLTGMIAATQSFRSPAVNARTLQNAGTLIEKGAQRERIMQHLFRERPLEILQLWGMLLSHLQSDAQLPLIYGTLTRDDLVRSGATEKQLWALLDELISFSPQAKVCALLYENPQAPTHTAVLIEVNRPYSLDTLTQGFAPVTVLQPHRARFSLPNTNLSTATTRVVNVLRAKMRG